MRGPDEAVGVEVLAGAHRVEAIRYACTNADTMIDANTRLSQVATRFLMPP